MLMRGTQGQFSQSYDRYCTSLERQVALCSIVGRRLLGTSCLNGCTNLVVTKGQANIGNTSSHVIRLQDQNTSIIPPSFEFEVSKILILIPWYKRRKHKIVYWGGVLLAPPSSRCNDNGGTTLKWSLAYSWHTSTLPQSHSQFFASARYDSTAPIKPKEKRKHEQP